MSSKPKSKKTTIIVAAIAVVAFCVLIYNLSREKNTEEDWTRTAAVAVEPISTRSIVLHRVFSGALEAHSKFVVAPKVAGRVIDIPVDISDLVQRGDTVALLDDAEFSQAFRQAEADLAVAEANLAEASSTLEIAKRSHRRVSTLRERSIASDSEFDSAQAELLARQAEVKVAEAQVVRAQSSLESARIRLGYTKIAADWAGGEDTRVVADRYVDEGETVSPNEPLLLIVELNPITAVIYVTERDYALLKPGFDAKVSTDAFPGRRFVGKIDRISPVFRENSRQARVELSLENPDGALKPGMFVRADIALSEVPNATVVPYAAITRRGTSDGIFIVNEADSTVRWAPVQTGIRDGDTIQISGENLNGNAVVLGQHLLDDGTEIVIPDRSDLDLQL